MTKVLWTSLSRRLAAAVLFASVLVPTGAEAVPFLVGSDGLLESGAECTSGAANCGLFTIDPTVAFLAGEFTADNDVALLQFMLGPGSFTFTASTASAATNFDPILTLFGPGGMPVTYTVGDEPFRAEAFDLTPDIDPVFPVLTLAGGTIYTLAISQYGPFDGSFAVGTLADGFTHDAFPCFTSDPSATQCDEGASLFGGQTGGFALNLSVTPQGTASVPEPGTLSLIAFGVAAAAVSRRARNRR